MTAATSTPSRAHPAQVLLDAQGGALHLPVCDHYSGVEVRMRKSLQLQAEMMAEFGTCVFDVTLDCEDGAPVGQEAAHARLVASLARDAAPGARVAARVHAVDHASFAQDLDIIVGEAGDRLCHLMLPKVESVDDVLLAERHLGRLGCRELPLHVLIESPAAVHRAFDIAAHPRVQSISFGLMDFVSAHGGAIPASAMGSAGQFDHPLVVRAKLEIAAACHAHGRCLRTAWSPSSGIHRRCRPLPHRRHGGSAIPACGASTRTRSVPSSPRSRPRPTKWRRPHKYLPPPRPPTGRPSAWMVYYMTGRATAISGSCSHVPTRPARRCPAGAALVCIRITCLAHTGNLQEPNV